MASSEVGIASSASPFGCVLRDHNWRDRININSRENCNNVETAFETKIKYFVQDRHLSANISESTPPKNPQDDTSQPLLNQENNTISDETRQNGCKREVSPSLSDDSSIETKTPGCVSSLVQRWRDFGNTRHVTEKTSNSNFDPNTALGKSNYFHESVEETTNENFGTPCSEKFDTPTMTIGNDIFLEDGEERERLRVADVIKKLKLVNETIGNGNEIKLKEHEKTPRIRGRQAFKDLLMQLEHDRHMELDRLVERRSVSKFSHRGRIQSVLRLRFLRRDAIVRHHHRQQQSKAIGFQHHSHSTPAPQQPKSCEESTIVDHPKISSLGSIRIKTQEPEANARKREQTVTKSIKEQNPHWEAAAADGGDSLPSQHNQMGQGSKVVLLREKFDVLDKADAATPKAPKGFAKSFSLCITSSTTSNQLGVELRQQQEVCNTTRTSCSLQNSISKETDEASNPTCEVDNNCSLESEKIPTVSTRKELSNNLEEHDRNISAFLRHKANCEADNSCSLKLRKVSILANGRELSNNLQGHDPNDSASLQLEANCDVDNFYTPPCEKTMAISDEDHQNNQEPSDHQILESGEEWRNDDIQYWNEWDEEYISNLNWVSDIARPKSDWENLRQARYRDMLDSDEENDEMRILLERKTVSTFLTSNLRDTMDQLMISRVERVPQSMEHRLKQIFMSSIQTQPNIEKTEEEKEGTDSNFSDQVKYSSLEQPQSSQSSCPDTQPFSALTNRSSIDQDYMYDLRVYMEQLHQEVSELRKTVNRCMDMQEKMHSSIKHEVSVAVDLSVGRAMQGSANNTARTRSCCLCYEMQVNSLLYRCGHMCTCYKCAHELQWSTGKCPICQAPILDVVQVNHDVNFSDRR